MTRKTVPITQSQSAAWRGLVLSISGTLLAVVILFLVLSV
jgi:hypothetical protein